MALSGSSLFPVFPGEYIQLQGSGFGSPPGKVRCKAWAGGQSIDLDVVPYTWSDEVAVAWAPTVEQLQPLALAGLDAHFWPRALCIPLLVEVVTAAGVSMGIARVPLYLGAPIAHHISTLDLTLSGTRSFSIQGWGFGLQAYGDVYFFVSEPPWRDDVLASLGTGSEFAAGLDSVPPPDLITVKDAAMIVISDAQSQAIIDHAQANGVRLTPFVTSWSEYRIDISLPFSVDLGLLPYPDAFHILQTLECWIVVFRNLVPSRPGKIFVTQVFFTL